MPTVHWSQIETECGNYREGFVAVFRHYEGQPTDEKDGQGRTVKVTASSFARHVGIDKSTFGRWVRSSTSTPPHPSDARADERGMRSEIRRASRLAPDLVVDAIMEAPVEQQDEIVRDLIARRRTDDNIRVDHYAKRSAWDAMRAVTDWALQGRGLAKHLQSSPAALNKDAREVVAGRLDEIRMTADLLDDILVGRSKGVDEISTWLSELPS